MDDLYGEFSEFRAEVDLRTLGPAAVYGIHATEPSSGNSSVLRAAMSTNSTSPRIRLDAAKSILTIRSETVFLSCYMLIYADGQQSQQKKNGSAHTQRLSASVRTDWKHSFPSETLL